MVSFDDFKKIDLRIARITEVQEHPNADRLYLIAIEIGDKQKQVVAGLKGHYSPEELKGKEVVVVDNLEPATIRGIKSEGMILAAQGDEKIAIIVPEKEVKTGSLIK